MIGEVKYSKEIPEIYAKCKEQFGVDWNDGIIITYGDTIYCKHDISEDFKVHEQTHIRQQAKMGVEEWWMKYLSDKDFRLSQEVEAYRNQWQFILNNCSRRIRKLMAKHIIDSMAGMYGNMCSRKKAKLLVGI